MNKRKIEYDIKKEEYQEYEVIDRATVKFIEAVVDRGAWTELDTGDEFLDKNLARTILKHLEKKFTEDQPVAINEEEKILNTEIAIIYCTLN